LSAFLATGLSQSNPNSPPPPAPPACQFGGPGTSPGKYVWPKSAPNADNLGWQLQGVDCATSAQPTPTCPAGYSGSGGTVSWNGSSWVTSGATCSQPAAPAVSACPSGDGGSPGAYTWSNGSWVFGGRTCYPLPTALVPAYVAPVVPQKPVVTTPVATPTSTGWLCNTSGSNGGNFTKMYCPATGRYSPRGTYSEPTSFCTRTPSCYYVAGASGQSQYEINATGGCSSNGGTGTCR